MTLEMGGEGWASIVAHPSLPRRAVSCALEGLVAEGGAHRGSRPRQVEAALVHAGAVGVAGHPMTHPAAPQRSCATAVAEFKTTRLALLFIIA